ncbi:MAG: 1-deoxy-D-xylulose-5-phosphate synthase, partial [Clostridia bacterium]|nr:1-deoxy-D-xylulose-5-phosphate synthase [Clostridia bacterium]
MTKEQIMTRNSAADGAAFPLLDKLRFGTPLSALPEADMPALCGEIRRFLVEKVTASGGHLASNLGVVEMTVAAHRIFDLPRDRLIFDVGHQSYVHKILSGRMDRFDTLRKPGGLSGFETMREGPYDAFGTGHASTSVSAALGYAEADRIAGRDNFTVAVLGDGAFTGGMIHEALNNCKKDLNLIIVLNENEMSISRNTGRFAKHIAKMRTSKRYFRFKRRFVHFFEKIPLIGEPINNGARAVKRHVKSAVYGSVYFEDIGIKYLGPADGNNYAVVRNLFEEAKTKGGCSIVHLRTVKGKGYAPAERDPAAYHQVGADYAGNFSSHFGEKLCEMAEDDEKICAITAAMETGVGLSGFHKQFPDRFFDVGIAEAHALTFAAGLAAAGMKPYAAVYSTFLQRSYDSILHDIALQNLPVRILIDRAALSSGDGATHHGIFDVSFLSAIPNVCLFAPMSFSSFDRIMEVSRDTAVPLAIRYPNAPENPEILHAFFEKGPADALVHADFDDPEQNIAVIVTYGKVVTEALAAAKKLTAQGFPCGVILMELLKPYDASAAEVAARLPRHAAAVLFME